MLPIVSENRNQLIKMTKSQEIDISTIRYALIMAKANKRYAKFYTNKYYIEVAYRRDNTVRISSNYRNNFKFDRQLTQLENNAYNLSAFVNFIYLWTNRIRKL